MFAAVGLQRTSSCHPEVRRTTRLAAMGRPAASLLIAIVRADRHTGTSPGKLSCLGYLETR
jgi:hypothetical protein